MVGHTTSCVGNVGKRGVLGVQGFKPSMPSQFSRTGAYGWTLQLLGVYEKHRLAVSGEPGRTMEKPSLLRLCNWSARAAPMHTFGWDRSQCATGCAVHSRRKF